MLGHKHEADAAHTSWLSSKGLSPECTPVLWLLGFRQSHLHPCFPHKPSPDIPNWHFLLPLCLPICSKGTQGLLRAQLLLPQALGLATGAKGGLVVAAMWP